MQELDQSTVQRKNKNFTKFLIKQYFKQIEEMPLYPLASIDWINFNKKKFKYLKRNELLIINGLNAFLNTEIPENLNFERRNRKFLAELLRSRDFIFGKILHNRSIK